MCAHIFCTPLPLRSQTGDARKKNNSGSDPDDLLPAAGTINITYEAEKETARHDVRLLLARESFLVGQLVADADDSLSIQRLKSD